MRDESIIFKENEKENTELVPGDQMFATINGRHEPIYFLNITILNLHFKKNDQLFSQGKF